MTRNEATEPTGSKRLQGPTELQEATGLPELTGQQGPGMRRTAESKRRAEQMVGMRFDGYSLQEIGTAFGVTRERVRQIIRDAGGPDSAEAAAARRARVQRAQEALRQQTLALIGEQPGLSAGQVAEVLGASASAVRESLGDDARRLLVSRHRPGSIFSDEIILRHLREAARLVGQPLTFRAYEEAREMFGGASAPLVLQRFGSWRNACRSAGIEPGNPVRRNYRRRWSRDQLVDAVAEYLSDHSSRGSFADYERWARSTDGMPSGQTIRTQFGTWSSAKTEALAVLASRQGGVAGDGEHQDSSIG